MFLLLITLYISGVCIKKGREFKWWQSAILFYITAGVTLSNGIKVFLSGFFVNLRDFFRPKYLLLAVILPAALLWVTATWEYQQYVLPQEKTKAELKVRKAEELKARVAQMTPKEREQFEKRKARRQELLRRQAAKTGKPMEDHGFLKWTDITTSRWQSVYENLFGESVRAVSSKAFLGGYVSASFCVCGVRLAMELCGGGSGGTAFHRRHLVRTAKPFSVALSLLLRLRYVHSLDFRLWPQRGVYHGSSLYVRPAHRHSLPFALCKDPLAPSLHPPTYPLPLYL